MSAIVSRAGALWLQRDERCALTPTWRAVWERWGQALRGGPSGAHLWQHAFPGIISIGHHSEAVTFRDYYPVSETTKRG